MATGIPANSVWSAMSYTPPRGRCNYKTSLMSPACPCMRFMLHPVKAATSFECDGCAHHASFHSLENKEEDAIIKRWEAQEAAEKENKKPKPRAHQQAITGARTNTAQPASKKRKMIAEKEEREYVLPGGFEITEIFDEDEYVDGDAEKVEKQVQVELEIAERKTRGRRGAT